MVDRGSVPFSGLSNIPAATPDPNWLTPEKRAALTPEQRENPFIKAEMETPSLTEWDRPVSLGERFMLNNEAMFRHTALGAGEAAMYVEDATDVDFTNPAEVADYLRGQKIKERQAEWEAMRPSRNPLEWSVGMAGGITGLARGAPEFIVGPSSKWVQGGMTALSRILRASASNAAINTAFDPVVQMFRMNAGLQETYQPLDTALAAAAGAILPGAIQTGIEVWGRGAARFDVPPVDGEADPRLVGLPDDAAPPRAEVGAPGEGRPVDLNDPAEILRDVSRKAQSGEALDDSDQAIVDTAKQIGLIDDAGNITELGEQATAQPPRITPEDVADDARAAAPAADEPAPEVVVDEAPVLRSGPEPIAEAPDTIPPTPGQRAGVFLFDPRELQVDAQTFQFKQGGDDAGVTPILRGVTSWNPDAAGQLVVWQRRDGSFFVADGHQRVGLAKRLLSSGQESDITIPGSLYREADGFSAEDAMVIAAMKNIREGSGDIMDAARVLRITPGEIDSIAEIGRTATRNAVSMTRLSDDVWRMAVNGVIDPREAAAIGRIVPDDPEVQRAAAEIINRLKPANEAETEMLVRRVRDTELVKAQKGAQASLLGDLDAPESTVAEEISIVSRAIKTLARDKNILRRVAANAGRLEEVGSQIAVDQAVVAANQSAQLADLVEKVAFTRGDVRTALLQLAQEVKNGERSVSDAVEGFIVALRRADQPGAAGGGTAGGGGLVDAPAGDGEADNVIRAPFGADRLQPEVKPPQEATLLGTGDKLVSESGRELAPVPKIDLSSPRKAGNTMRRIDDWLLSEARKEAEETGNDWMQTLLKGLDTKNFSQSDRDTVNLFLFGQAEGATDAHRVGDIAALVTPLRPMVRIAADTYRTGDFAILGSGAEWRIGKPVNWDDPWAGMVEGTDARFRTLSEAREAVDRATRAGGVQGRLFATPAPAQRDLAQLAEEAGADGRPQTVLPGGERISQADLAQRRANAPLRPRVEQRFDVGGLFGDGDRQMDLVDMAREAGQEVTFKDRLIQTQNPNAPAVRGADEWLYRIKPEGDGYIGVKLPDDLFGQPEYFRPRDGSTWSAETAAGRIVDALTPVSVILRGEDQYVDEALRNLKATSRTARGVLDVSSSVGKGEKLTEGLTGESAAVLAVRNFERTFREIYNALDALPQDAAAMAEFMDQVASSINEGIVRPGELQRTLATKYPQTAVEDLPAAKLGFAQEFIDRLNDPNADPIETAAWVEWRANLADHYWADGVGKTTKALAAIPLMKEGLPLPQYPAGKGTFEYAPKGVFDPKDGGATYLNEEWDRFLNYYRTFFERDGATSRIGAEMEAVAAASDVHAMTMGEQQSLRAMIKRKASIDELAAHPAVRKAVADQNSIPTTDSLPGYGTEEYFANRRYVFGVDTDTPEEVVGADAAIARLVEKARSYAPNGAPEKGRQAIIVLGPPAAGKSTIAESLATYTRAAIIDPDDAKLVMPEYAGGLGAHAVHEESSELTFGGDVIRGVIEHLVDDGSNLVIPKVGAGAGSIRRLILHLRDVEGYEVKLANMRVSPNEAYRRMIGRFIDTNRLISSDYFMSIGWGPSETYRSLKTELTIGQAIEIDGEVPKGVIPRVVDGENTPFADEFLRSRGGGEPGDRTVYPETPAGEGAPRATEHALIGPIRGTPLEGETSRPFQGVPDGAAPEAQRLSDISKQVTDSIGMTVRQGRLRRVGGKAAIGTYDEATGVTRLREIDYFDVLSHEGGHQLNFRVDPDGINGLVGQHAREVGDLAYEGAPDDRRLTEGFAEWFRLWMTNPEYVRGRAPVFTQAMEEFLQDKHTTLWGGLKEAQEAYQAWLKAPSRSVVTGDLVSSSLPPTTARIGKALKSEKLPTGQTLFSFFDRFYTWTVDRLHPINRATKALREIYEQNTGRTLDMKMAEDPYILSRLAVNAHQGGHVDLIHGVVPYREINPVGPSLAEALELAVGKNWYGFWRSDDMLEFGGYLTARRSVREFERFFRGEVPNPPGKLTLGDYRMAITQYEAAHPQFRKAADMLYEWQANLLKKKFDAGLITKSQYDMLSGRSDYVPFMRDFSERVDEFISASSGTTGTNRQSIMKKYRGSMRSIINPIESIVEDAYRTSALIARNDVITMLADLAKRAGPGGGAIAEEVPDKMLRALEVDVAEVLKAAGKDAGLNPQDIDDLIVAAMDGLDSERLMTTIFRAADAPAKGEPIVYFWRGGKRHALRLADGGLGKELFEAMTGMGREASNWMIDTLAVPARALRLGITGNPAFLLANYVRDQTQAFILNENFIPLWTGARGTAEELLQTEAARLYAQAGGIMGGANVASLNQARINRSLRALQKKGYAIQRLKDPRELLKLTEVTETGTRIGLFKSYFASAQKRGLSQYESMIEAAFQARDFMDFGRHGSKLLFARKLVTFMNASIQGLDKSGRVLFGDLAPLAKAMRGRSLSALEKRNIARSAKAWVKINAIGVMSMLYGMQFSEDPEWQDASEYFRATHWLFPMGGGKWAAVPKPYEMATVFNFYERLGEAISRDDPTWAQQWLRSMFYTMSVPTEPAGIMTPIELAFNYDRFRDRNIVPEWQLGLEPFQQFNSYTSEFSKFVGKAINVSPAKIDHLIVGWTGSWGRDLLSLTNTVDQQRRPDALYDWPIIGRFVKNLARGSDATDKFYRLVAETGGRLERRNNTYKELIRRGQDDEAQVYYDSLSDDEKVWVATNSLESANEKRVHPLYRAGDVLTVLSGMRRDVTNRNIVTVLSDEKIEINPTHAWMINDQLSRMSAAEARNAMIAVGEPGWASREVIDTQEYLDAIREIDERVYTEVLDRLDKKQVLPFDGVRAVWPRVKERLLEEGTESFLGDLRFEALAY